MELGTGLYLSADAATARQSLQPFLEADATLTAGIQAKRLYPMILSRLVQPNGVGLTVGGFQTQSNVSHVSSHIFQCRQEPL